MKTILTLLVVLALLAIGMVMGSQNTQTVTVSYLIAATEMPLSRLIAILLGLGVLLGLLMSALWTLSLKLRLMRLQRQVKSDSNSSQS